MALGEQGVYVAIYFPNDDPPGWYWGKPLSSAERIATSKFWVNFTAMDQEYDAKDNVRLVVASFVGPEYGKTWALVAPKDKEFHHNE